MTRQHQNKIDFGSLYFYREFLKLHKDLAITEQTYTKILKTFFHIVVRRIVLDAYRFIFPSIGELYLVKEKQKIIKDKEGKIKSAGSIDWPETKRLIKKTGDKTKKVYYLNDHTDRHIYTIVWRKNLRLTNKSFYTFNINTKHKQYLHDKILESVKPLNAFSPWSQ